MKHLAFLFILFNFSSFAQKTFYFNKLKQLEIERESLCDDTRQLFEEGAILGTLPLGFDSLTAILENDTLFIKGKVVDGDAGEYNMEGATLFSARTKDPYCNLISVLGASDRKGWFKVSLPKDSNISLYARLTTYWDLELKMDSLHLIPERNSTSKASAISNSLYYKYIDESFGYYSFNLTLYPQSNTYSYYSWSHTGYSRNDTGSYILKTKSIRLSSFYKTMPKQHWKIQKKPVFLFHKEDFRIENDTIFLRSRRLVITDKIKLGKDIK